MLAAMVSEAYGRGGLLRFTPLLTMTDPVTKDQGKRNPTGISFFVRRALRQSS